MWLEKGAPALIVVLLIAVSLAGCDRATDSSATDSASPAAPWWKGRPPGDGIAPSFNSAAAPKAVNGGNFASSSQGVQPVLNSAAAPKAVNGGNFASSSQGVQPVRDASVAQTVNSLTAVATPGNRAYRIGPLDVLDISVFQAPDLTKTVEVADTGTIDLPLVGQIPASGKTAQELQRDLNSRLGAKYLQNPQATVIVKEFNSNRVTVSGAVKSPGVFPYKGQTLFQFVTMAGGLAFEANSTILVLRETNGERSAAKFDAAAIQTGRAPDPPVQAGDIIVADTSSVKSGYNSILKILPLAGLAAFATL